MRHHKNFVCSSTGTAKLNPRMGFSNEESFSGGRGSNKDDMVNKDFRVSDKQDTDGSNKMEISPTHEDFKNKHSQSPRTGCSRSVRFVSPLNICTNPIF